MEFGVAPASSLWPDHGQGTPRGRCGQG